MSLPRSSPLIQLLGATLSRSNKIVLHDLYWSMRRGEHWVLLGANGAGKSSFMQMLAGILRPVQEPELPQHARIVWNISGTLESSPLVAKEHTALVSPELQRTYQRQSWNISAEEIILSGFYNNYLLYTEPEAEKKQAVYTLAKKLHLEDLLGLPLERLSQGQLRRILIARALVRRAPLLLLDEPLDGVDAPSRPLLFAAIEACIAAESSLVCSAHRREDIPACITHALLLEQGRIIASGALDSPLIQEALLSLEISASVPASPTDPLPAPTHGVTCAVQSYVHKLHELHKQALPPLVLQLRTATVYRDRHKVLHALTWEVSQGENWLISGANGAGKSTLLRLLMGEEHCAVGGFIRWFGEERFPVIAELRHKVGLVSDWLEADYMYDVSAQELVLSGFAGSILGQQEYSTSEHALATEWIAFLNLTQYSQQRISRLSKGVFRRFLLARALVGMPQVLILDEPCSGLDSTSRRDVMQLLEHVCAMGVQLLYVSHHAQERPSMITHELHLSKGCVVYAGKLRQR